LAGTAGKPSGLELNTEVNKFPTPYPDINQVLLNLLDNARAILGDYFTGMYLYGSLAGGDFDPGRSDIDPIVVTGKELSDNLISDLKVMHRRIYESGSAWATKMTGAYIPVNAMRKYSPTGAACPLFNRNEFLVARPDPDWVIHRHILYTCGVVITGPPLQNIIDPVSSEELQDTVLTLLRNNWASLLRNTDIFIGTGHQSFIVLTMCRALYTLKCGSITSKPRSAEWAIANLDNKWTELIEQAAAWHNGNPPGDISQTQEFLRYVLKEAGL
jgi:hypothetical protein